MLDNAGQVSEPHPAKRISTVASVIEDQPVLGVDGIHEIRAETDSEPDNAYQVARGRVVLDLVGLHGHRAEETQIVRWGHEDEGVVVDTGPFHGRLGMIVRETGPEECICARRRPQFIFKVTDEGQVDVFLVYYQTVQLDPRHLSGYRVESVAH